MGRIVAISNQKGGVGKTTTAVNLAASLGAAERKTLLIDIDPQANATSGIGLSDPQLPQREIYQVLLGQVPASNAIYATGFPYVDILPATAELAGFEVEAIELSEREHCLKNALASIRQNYEFLLIDCPPSLGLLTINALTAADGVLVPLQCEYYALEGLGRLMGTIELISKGLNPSLMLDGIVLTMLDRRNNLTQQVEDEVKSHFENKLWNTRVPRNVRLSEAPSFGKPILFYDIKSIGAQSYLALAEEFIKRTYEGGLYDRKESPGARTSISDSNAQAVR